MIKNELLKVKIAKLYYQNGLSKIEIGEKLRISRLKVAGLLEDTVKEGIVKIFINEPKESFIDLENELEKRFKIYHAIVAETSIDYESTKKNIGKAAASYLVDTIYDNDVIGVAWGSTTYEAVNYLPDKIKRKNITVVQITGGSNQVPININASELTRRVANIFNAKSYFLHAPVVVKSKEARDILYEEAGIKNTLDMFNKINLAIVGIGTTRPELSSTLYKDGFIKKEDFNNSISFDCIGDINSYFYNMKGDECHTILRDRVIAMNLEQLKKVRYVMAVAGSENKTDAIIGALKGRIINIIVTDSKTAEAILAKND
ncbi:MAG: sugar-binding transcriptional regulator [Actinobacteria bacterium]|nr:sugar-binding transcriptional regulator [Actinomycetota bacterium]